MIMNYKRTSGRTRKKVSTRCPELCGPMHACVGTLHNAHQPYLESDDECGLASIMLLLFTRTRTGSGVLLFGSNPLRLLMALQCLQLPTSVERHARILEYLKRSN